jgi:hypothetical protein
MPIEPKGIEGDKGLSPEAAGRATDEDLAVLDDAAFGAATEVTPKFVSPSDPAARWTGARRPSLLRLLDELPGRHRQRDHRRCRGDHGIRQAEVLAAKRMIQRSLERFDLYPSRLLGDRAYGSAWVAALRAWDRAARDRLRQVGPHGRDLLARRLHL